MASAAMDTVNISVNSKHGLVKQMCGQLVRPMYVYIYDVRMVCSFVLSAASVADMSATGLTYGSLTSQQLLPPCTP